MKLKGLRKILIGVLCSTFIATGAVAYNGFTANANSAEITVSSDIQRIIDGYNNGTASGAAYEHMSAKYVKDYQMPNGQTASGVLVTVDASDVPAGHTREALVMPNFTFNGSALTATDKLLGYYIVPGALNDGTFSSGVEFAIVGADGKGFTYQNSAGGEGVDNATTQKVTTTIRGYLGGTSYNYMGLYYKNSTANSYGNRSFKAVSLNGYQKNPHHIYYDFNQNALYNDVYGLHDGDTYELARIFGVDAKNYASLGAIKVSPNSNPTLTDTLKNYTGSNTVNTFGGFSGGTMRIGIRLNLNAGKTGSVLLTSYAGIDLTNPTNVAPTKQIIKFNSTSNYVYSKNVNGHLPDAKEFGCFYNVENKTFVGNVNIYKTNNPTLVKYGALGQPADPVAEGLTCKATVNVNTPYTFTETGYYVLEYVTQNGPKAYKIVSVVDDVISANGKLDGNVSVNELASKFASTNGATVTAVQGSATTVGSNVTFNGIKLNVQNEPDATGKNVATIDFNQIVNVSGFRYNNFNSNVPFIGLVPIPSTAMEGTMPSTTAEKLAKINRGDLKLNNEFTNVRIILTDAHDESNKIVIDFSFNGTQEGSPDGVNENGVTYYNSQVNVAGWSNGVGGNTLAYCKQHGVKYGAPRQFSFLGYQTEATKLIYDYEKNALFTNVTGNKNEGTSSSYLLKYFGVPGAQYNTIQDVDNGGYYKASTDAKVQDTWNGFTNGEVKLSMELTFESGVTSGNLMVTDLFGLDLSSGEANVQANKYSSYVSTEGVEEYTNAGEFVIPTAKYGSSLLATNFDYAGSVDVKLNGAVISTAVATGSTINLDKPGAYEFIYKYENGGDYVVKTKVNGKYNVVINGGASLLIGNDSYSNGNVIETYENLTAKVLLSKNNYFESITFVSDSNANVVYNFANYLLTANVDNLCLNGTITVTAREYHTLTYKVKNQFYQDILVEQGSTIVVPNDPYLEGYDFMGWNLNNQMATSSKTFEKTDDYKGINYELNAVFNPIIYTVNVKVDEAFASKASIVGGATTGVYTIESDLSYLPALNITDNEYVFAGWFYKGKLITSGSQLPCANGETVTACLAKKYYEITYYDGNEVLGSDKFLYGEKSSIKDVSKDGYVLEGWYTDANKTQKYTFGSALNSNVTLYANWVKVESGVIDGVQTDGIVNESTVINGATVGALHNVSVLGIIALSLAGVGLVVAIVMGVLLIVKKRK